MVGPKYEFPNVNETAFNCLHCRAYAQQFWFRAAGLGVEGAPKLVSQADISTLVLSIKNFTANVDDIEQNMLARKPTRGVPIKDESNPVYFIYFSECSRCRNFAIWVDNCVVWPRTSDAPLPNPDLPDNMRVDYEEASAILSSSPRGSAALLRLVVEKLCKHLGEKGDRLNDNIASLVEKGLDADIQKALDTIRIIGNNSVHPGLINLQDDEKTARSLFDLVNLIVDSMISQKKKVRKMYDNLPVSSRQSVEKRDK